jgi:hypothetical protein
MAKETDDLARLLTRADIALCYTAFVKIIRASCSIIGAGSRSLCNDQHRLAGVRACDSSLRSVPHDCLLGRRDSAEGGFERHYDHARTHAACSGAPYRLAAGGAVPAKPYLAGVPEINGTTARGLKPIRKH